MTVSIEKKSICKGTCLSLMFSDVGQKMKVTIKPAKNQSRAVKELPATR